MKKILVAEDEPTLREGIVTAFRDRGWQVTEAGDGAEAMERLENEVFDVLVTDYKMPHRTGLDVLKRMQQDIPNVVVKITIHDFSHIREADLKLVELAKRLKGIIITNDFNLNKVAGLPGVKVMNLNQLSSALKPVVLPGETMNIRVVKEGKEENQGIGYLEDGTMVVVDDAKKYLGRDIEVSVTSVLQTPTGRMIFSRVKEEGVISDIAG